MTIEWKNPPNPSPGKVDIVADQLRTRPREWALIAKDTEEYVFCWWNELRNDPNFELKNVDKGSSIIFGKRDVYARYVGPRD